MTTLPIGNAIGPECFRGSLLTALLLALCCFALSPAIQAVTPAPDGGYPGGNTAEGQNALQSLTSGPWNTALGFQALYHNTTGNSNTAEGYHALFTNATGSGNTANGGLALFSNTTASHNTANGVQALYGNTTGGYNTADGFQALASNTTGGGNVANGVWALQFNTTGRYNTANGDFALNSNTTGNSNTANGSGALSANRFGSNNTANGDQALFSNTTGSTNTANGYQALYSNTTGGFNIALGYHAGVFLTTGGDNIDIGNAGMPGESGTIRIGTEGTQTSTFIAGIYGVNEGGTLTAVYINGNNGQLGTQPPPSSRRFKKEIRPMDQTSQAILGLKPVTFQYKSDPTSRAQFGLIAEEVAEVDPDLVVRDAEGEIYSVRYEAVNAMLLNEFLKEHRTVQELKSTAAKQEAIIAKQQKQIEALTTGLQQVSYQLELSKPAPRTVVKNH